MGSPYSRLPTISFISAVSVFDFTTAQTISHAGHDGDDRADDGVGLATRPAAALARRPC